MSAPVRTSNSPFVSNTKRRMLMTPELFETMGGISRMMRLYLLALCELSETDGRRVQTIALNDTALDSSDQKRYSTRALSDIIFCDHSKRNFVEQAWRMSRSTELIICGHIGQLPVAWALSLLRPQIRYALVAHGIEVWRPFSFLEKLALRRAFKVLCVSDYTRKQLLSHVTLKPGVAVVFPNALDPYFSMSEGTPWRDTKPTLLSISRLSADDTYKGIDNLILAMPAIRKVIPDALLRIVGRGDHLPYLQRLAEKEGVLNNGVEFLGYLADSEMLNELSSCRMFALPSKGEGFGLVYLEAMAQGRPCLCANIGGGAEIITPETGLQVPFGDVEATAAACIEGLQRSWNSEVIVKRAGEYSYSRFKSGLRSIIDS